MHQRGHEQGQRCGHRQAPDDAGRKRPPEQGIAAPAKGKRDQAANDGQRGDDDRHQTTSAGVERGRERRQSAREAIFAGGNQHDGRVHRDAGQRDAAIQRVKRDRLATDQQTERDAGQRHRRRRKNDQRQHQPPELHREQRVHQHKTDHHVGDQIVQTGLDVVQFATLLQADTGMARRDAGPGCIDGSNGLARGDAILVKAGVQSDGAVAVDATQFARRGFHRHGEQFSRIDRAPVRQTPGLGQPALHLGLIHRLATYNNFQRGVAAIDLADRDALEMQAHQSGQFERIEAGTGGGRGIDLQGQAGLAEPGVVIHIVETGHVCQRQAQITRGFGQAIQRRSGQPQGQAGQHRQVGGKHLHRNTLGARRLQRRTQRGDIIGNAAPAGRLRRQTDGDLPHLFADDHFTWRELQAGHRQRGDQFARPGDTLCRQFEFSRSGQRGFQIACRRHLHIDVEHTQRVGSKPARLHPFQRQGGAGEQKDTAEQCKYRRRMAQSPEQTFAVKTA